MKSHGEESESTRARAKGGKEEETIVQNTTSLDQITLRDNQRKGEEEEAEEAEEEEDQSTLTLDPTAGADWVLSVVLTDGCILVRTHTHTHTHTRTHAHTHTHTHTHRRRWSLVAEYLSAISASFTAAKAHSLSLKHTL
jgi:ABC-type nickel/cobalt efflux system permease component RcnA